MQVLTRLWKGSDLWVLEPSLPTQARSTFYIVAACFGLLLIFFSDGAMIILTMNLRTPQKHPVRTDTPWSLQQLQETGQKMSSVLIWLAGKILLVAISIHHFFSLQNHSSYEGMAVSFLPLLCVFFVMIFSSYACLVQSGCQGLLQTSVQLGNGNYTYLQLQRCQKILITIKTIVKEYTSQRESGVISTSDLVQVLMVSCLFYTPSTEAATSSICTCFTDRAQLTLHISNCPGDFMSLLPTHTQSQQL